MAKHTDKIGGYNFDTSFDEGFSSDFDDLGKDKPSKKNNRTPKTSIEAIKGLGRGMTNSNSLKMAAGAFISKVLPKRTYDVYRDAEELVSGAYRTYHDTVTEVKPTVNRISREVDRLLPDEMKRSKEFIKKIKDATNSRDDVYPSESSQRETSIGTSLAEIFAADAEQRVEDRARDHAEATVRDRMSLDRHNTNIGIMNSISIGINKLAQYNDKVNFGYQKKSLELQFRSYHAQLDLLDHTKKYNETFKQLQESIMHNTALPDFVKITKTEMAKQGLMSKLGNSLYSREGLLGKGFDKIKQKAVSKFGELSESFSTGLQMAGDIKEQSAMDKEVGESGSKAGLAAEMFVAPMMLNQFAEWLGGKLGKKVKEHENGRVGSLVKKYGNKLKDPGTWAKELLKSEYLDENKDMSFGLHRVLKDTLRGIISSFTPDGVNMKMKSSKVNDLSGAAIFDNGTRKSIVEIIPGYLARILQAVGPAGSKLVTYDHTKNKFVNEDVAKLNTKSFLQEQLNPENVARKEIDHLNMLKGTTKVLGRDGKKFERTSKFTPDQEVALVKVMRATVEQDEGFGVQQHIKAIKKANLSKEEEEFVRKHFRKNFGANPDGSVGKLDRETDLIEAGMANRESTKDIRGLINAFIENGKEDLLPEGLIEPVRGGAIGEVQINESVYRR